ncbi:uncharacterized protein PG986_004934 [Apiospora aurea]|uniref:Uncharacterized protein n=1 Tax=Apiospora aurea TaxID=335848 RepID=A0ABR1QG39_9PEZI
MNRPLIPLIPHQHREPRVLRHDPLQEERLRRLRRRSTSRILAVAASIDREQLQPRAQPRARLLAAQDGLQARDREPDEDDDAVLQGGREGVYGHAVGLRELVGGAEAEEVLARSEEEGLRDRHGGFVGDVPPGFSFGVAGSRRCGGGR